MVAIATICVTGTSEVQSLSPQEMDVDIKLEAQLKACQMATSHALDMIKAGKIQSLSASKVFRKAEAEAEAEVAAAGSADNQPSKTVQDMEKKDKAQEDQEEKDTEMVKKVEEKAEVDMTIENMGSTPSEKPKVEQNAANAERIEEDTAKKLEATAEESPVELGEGELSSALPGSQMHQCEQAALRAITEAMKQKNAERVTQSESQKAINDVEDEENTKPAGNPGTDVAKAAKAVAAAASPIEKLVAKAELVDAERDVTEGEKSSSGAQKKSVVAAEKVATFPAGTLGEAVAAGKAVKKANCVEDKTGEEFIAKKEEIIATIQSAKKAKKAPADMVVKADKTVEKELEQVKNSTPQGALVNAVAAEQASEDVLTAVRERAPSAEIKTLEAKAVVEAKKKPKTSAATTVAEVNAVDAAEAAVHNPTAQNQAKLVVDVEKIQNPSQNTPQVKAVSLSRQKQATHNVQENVVTKEEKRLAEDAPGMVLARVKKAEEDATEVQTEAPPTENFKAQIMDTPSVKEEAKENGFSNEVVQLAKSKGPIAHELNKIVKAKKTPSTDGLTQQEKEKQAKELMSEANSMFQPQPLKNDGDKSLKAEEEEQAKVEIPPGGFSEPIDDME